MTTSVSVIITAGGTSSRFGSNKLLEKINGKEVIKWVVDAFEGHEIILCGSIELPGVKTVPGGATRQQSVLNGLKACTGSHVLIHDGARPLITRDLIDRAIKMTIEKGAMTVAVKTTDTIKEVQNGVVVRTIDRTKLYNTQTPQGFERNLIMRAHMSAQNMDFTDDASMVEALGEKVYILEGDPGNIKITTPNDIAVASGLLSGL